MRLVVGVWWVIPAVASLELALLQYKQPYGPKMCALLCEGSSELLCSFSATELSCKVFGKARAVVAAAANSSSELKRTLIQQTREVTTVRRNNFRTNGRRRIKKKVRIQVFDSGDGRVLTKYQHFEKRTWDAALRICQSEGGSLIKINTQEKENAITHNMKKSVFSRDYVWIGLRDITDTNTFVWTDNSSLTHHHWGRGQPSNFSKGRAGLKKEDCVGILSNRFFGVHWNDLSCSRKITFLCETIE